MRVVAALSGGVDSAVAAALAVNAGHDVVGVHMALATSADHDGNRAGDSLGNAPRAVPESTGGQAPGPICAAPAGPRAQLPDAHARTRGCCTPTDRHDAARAADVIGIPFYVWDFAAEFERDVVADFVAEYSVGRTPNPCIRCNQRIKFAAMLERAVALGFDAICTGHYARLVDAMGSSRTAPHAVRPVDDPSDESNRIELHRGVDAAKDQSYVLAVLTPEQLARSLFPLGEWTKPQVRAEAARRGLLVADKPDSSDICFIPGGDTTGWLSDRIGRREGRIIDAQTGESLGTHSGIETFTVGQRRGLRLTVPATDGEPRYVVSTNPARQEVAVGPARLLDVDQILVDEPNWCSTVPSLPFEAAIQIRAHGGTVKSVVESVGQRLDPPVDPPVDLPVDLPVDPPVCPPVDPPVDLPVDPPVDLPVDLPVDPPVDTADLASQQPQDRADARDARDARLRVRLTTPIRGVAAGQTLVMYDGTRVIGSATIVGTSRCADLASASDIYGYLGQTSG